MAENNTYTELAEKLGAPTSERFLAILHEMFTPEEASVCLELIIPGTVEDLKTALGYDEAILIKILDNLVDRGVLTRGETLFAFHSSLLGFHHDLADTGVHTGSNALPQKVKDLWSDFFYNEWSDIWVKSASDRKAAGGQGIMLTPAIGAIEISNISDDDLVPPMAIAGEGYRFHVTGLTHDEKGYPVMTAEAQDRLARRLVDKIRVNRKDIIQLDEVGTEDAEIVVCAYGITARVAHRAVQQARGEGIRAGLLRLITVWPFAEDRVIVVVPAPI